MEDRSGIIIRTPSGEETTCSITEPKVMDRKRSRKLSNGNGRKESFSKNKQEC
jgi:hypothetical protein